MTSVFSNVAAVSITDADVTASLAAAIATDPPGPIIPTVEPKEELDRLLERSIDLRREVKYDGKDFSATHIEGVQRIANLFHSSGSYPNIAGPGVSKEAAIARFTIALATGRQMGLTCHAACTGAAYINNKLTFYGDAIVASVYASGKCLRIDAKWTADRQSVTVSTVKICADGSHWEPSETYTMAQAKAAGYLSKSGPWKDHTERMLFIRARTWLLRNTFAEVLCGVADYDETMDIEESDKKQRETTTTAVIHSLSNPNTK